ncbi:MAG: helix-turn-helix transcriptional regulator [Clostridia bacterium]|nr:helix-turn-helix transcriptional regulator [Clostridia bacterium]
MNSDFPRIITLLRKERGLSQKQAAMELGVSQALLSHYEKGIRECGLDFVIHIADYYNVSCDYLLGRTPDRQGATLKLEDLPDLQNQKNDDNTKSNTLVTLNKKLILNSINIMYELLAQSNSKGLTTEVSSYLMVSVYKMLRTVYSANPKNPQAMFSVNSEMYSGLSSALMNIIETNATQISSGKPADGFQGMDNMAAPNLSPEVFSNQFPESAPSLYNLIQKTEEKIKKLT